MLCPFPKYSPVFQKAIRIISEDPDGYSSVSEGPDDYHMISKGKDKYHIPIQRYIWISDGSIWASLDKSKTRK
jgi:hypothetical protein